MGFLDSQAVQEASEEFWIIYHRYSWLPRENKQPQAKSGATPKDFQRQKEWEVDEMGDGYFPINQNISSY